jgi:hypothetical protein
MSKDALNEDLDLTPAERAKFSELVALLSKRGFGEAGPPRETTFAAIEQFGHRAGRMVARALDVHLTAPHAEHFTATEPCPACGSQQASRARPHDLPLLTDDGPVTLAEPAFRCPHCERDFFPGAHSLAD